MLLVVICSLLLSVLSIDIDVIFNTAVNSSIKQYCPFNDMKGLSNFCSVGKTVDKHLPIKLGTSWDPIKAQIKLPFFRLTYSRNKTYIINKIKYGIPDQVTLFPGDINSYIVSNNTYTTIDEYLAKMNPSRTNISSGTLSLPVDMIPELFKFFDTGHSNIVTVIETIKAYNLRFDNIDTLEISPFVKSAIDSLPATYDKEIYSMFINYWGTQIVVDADVGGMGEQTVMIKSCFGGIDASSQASLYMMKTFNPEQYSNVSFAGGFQQYSRASIIDIFGGNPKYVNISDWKTRVQTINEFPVITNVKTRPITDFIHNVTIKANLMKAINDYYTAGNMKIAQYRQDYLNSLKGGRLVTYIGTVMPNNNIISTQQMSLTSGGSTSVPKSPWSSWTPTSDYEGFGCARTSDNMIRSYVDGGYMSSVMAKENPYGDSGTWWSVNSGAGSDVVSGCSVSSYTFKLDRLTSIAFPLTSANMYGYCCMDCIPDIRCDKYCHFYGCGCPAF